MEQGALHSRLPSPVSFLTGMAFLSGCAPRPRTRRGVCMTVPHRPVRHRRGGVERHGVHRVGVPVCAGVAGQAPAARAEHAAHHARGVGQDRQPVPPVRERRSGHPSAVAGSGCLCFKSSMDHQFGLPVVAPHYRTVGGNMDCWTYKTYVPLDLRPDDEFSLLIIDRTGLFWIRTRDGLLSLLPEENGRGYGTGYGRGPTSLPGTSPGSWTPATRTPLRQAAAATTTTSRIRSSSPGCPPRTPTAPRN